MGGNQFTGMSGRRGVLHTTDGTADASLWMVAAKHGGDPLIHCVVPKLKRCVMIQFVNLNSGGLSRRW